MTGIMRFTAIARHRRPIDDGLREGSPDVNAGLANDHSSRLMELGVCSWIGPEGTASVSHGFQPVACNGWATGYGTRATEYGLLPTANWTTIKPWPKRSNPNLR